MLQYEFKIISPLPLDEARERLRSITKPPRSFMEKLEQWGVQDEKPSFIGEVKDSEFTLRRDISYRNSFLPVIRGSIGGSSRGSVIRATLTLPPVTLVFMLFWFGGLSVAAIPLIIFTLAAGNPAGLIPIGMLAFGAVLVYFGFFPEARKAERIFRELLQVQGSSPEGP